MKMSHLFLLVFMSVLSIAQPMADLNQKRDTSYSLSSAYNNVLSTHPNIKWPEKVLDFSLKQNIVYKTVGTKALHLDLIKPLGNSKKESFLIVHGGGWRTGNKGQHLDLAKHLAAKGYTCFLVEYRLSTEALFPAAVSDIKSAIKHIKVNASTYDIEPNAIIGLGFSAGAQLISLVGATAHNTLFDEENLKENAKLKAVVNLDGLLAFIHPESGEGDDSKKTSAASYWFGYSNTQKPELWYQGSALTHVSKNMPPILFINSSVDRMHAGREDFIKKLNEYDIKSEVKTFSGAPHSFVFFEPWFTPMLNTITQFINKL